MKDFDSRWQTLTKRANQAPAEAAPQVPWGLAARVSRSVRSRPQETWEEAFQSLGLRAALAALALFVFSAALVLSDWASPQLEMPEVSVSLGSELVWP